MAEQGSRNIDVSTTIATEAYISFVGELRVAGIDGVAFLVVNEPPAPPTFFIEVMMDLTPDNESSVTMFDRVAEAKAKFAGKLDDLDVCTAMAFVNTAERT